MSQEINIPKQNLSFWTRARKQYEGKQKPMTYEFNLRSTNRNPKKFSIFINKFITVFQQGMKQSYAIDNQDKENYWNKLEQVFSSIYEIDFIKTAIFDEKRIKLRQLFGLLIHSKKIFKFLQDVIQQAPQMYEDPHQKKNKLNEQLKDIDFLQDAKYTILGELVNQFQDYSEERKQRQYLQQQHRKNDEIQKQKQNQERLLKEKKQKQQMQLKAEQQRIQELKRQQVLQEIKAKKTQQEEKIQVDYAPDNYIRQRQTSFKYFTSQKPQLHLPTKQHKKHMKNSERLYADRYQGEHEVFAYDLQPKISQNKEVCFVCHEKLSEGLYFLGGNKNLCHYTGQWYCNSDFAQQRMALPWKAEKQFDLRGYPVSKVAKERLKSFYERPIIEIHNDAQVIKDHPKLYNFLVVRRQIHLMYDAICNLELIEPLFKKKLNYCLKINLFSLKNLYDIYNGQQQQNLSQLYEILNKHFYRCQICQKKRGYICPKCKDPVKIFPFELKQTRGCKKCRRLFHRKCLIGKCQCE